MKRTRGTRGFTLIEIILTLVLVGIVAVMAVSFFSTGVTRTDRPIAQLQSDAGLQAVLENMIQDYKQKYTTNLSQLKTNVGTANYYAPSGQSYVVVVNKYVKYSGATFVDDATGTNQYLLVTIKASTGSNVSLTYLFSKH